jgi:DNA-binding MarR family transcriptional regulator
MNPRTAPTPEETALLLKEAQAVLHQRMDEALRPLGLSVPQYACLEALADTPGISGSELARRTFVSRQAASVLLQGLERRGLATRDDEPGPRRERAAALTGKAERLLEDARVAVSGVSAAMTASLGEADRARLQNLLSTCRDALLRG